MLSEVGISLGLLKEKDIFGEIGFAYGFARSASVVAKEDSTLLLIDRNILDNLSKTDPAIKNILINNMVTSLSDKLTQANKKIERLTVENKKLKVLLHQSPSQRKEVNFNTNS